MVLVLVVVVVVVVVAVVVVVVVVVVVAVAVVVVVRALDVSVYVCMCEGMFVSVFACGCTFICLFQYHDAKVIVLGCANAAHIPLMHAYMKVHVSADIKLVPVRRDIIRYLQHLYHIS